MEFFSFFLSHFSPPSKDGSNFLKYFEVGGGGGSGGVPGGGREGRRTRTVGMV